MQTELCAVKRRILIRSLSLSYQKKDWQVVGHRRQICNLQPSQVKLYSRCHIKTKIDGPWLPILLLIWKKKISKDLKRHVFVAPDSDEINSCTSCCVVSCPTMLLCDFQFFVPSFYTLLKSSSSCTIRWLNRATSISPCAEIYWDPRMLIRCTHHPSIRIAPL